MADHKDIIASIRLGLDDLEEDMKSADARISEFTGKLGNKTKVELKIDLKNLQASVKQSEAAMRDLEKSFKHAKDEAEKNKIIVDLQALKKSTDLTKREIESVSSQISASGKKGGKGFGSGLKQGFDESDKQAKKFGANIVKSLGPMGLILAAVTFAVNLIKDAFAKATAGNEAATKSFSDMANIIKAVAQPCHSRFLRAWEKRLHL